MVLTSFDKTAQNRYRPVIGSYQKLELIKPT